MKILITYGGTLEPLDNVRHITNFSTGRTGARLAAFLAENGADVTALCSPHAAKLPEKCGVEIRHFTGFDSLWALMEEELSLQAYDAVIHAAAVSDYKVGNIEADNAQIEVGNGKIPSGCNVTLTLVPTPKIITQIQHWAPHAKLIGFKLTDTPDVTLRRAAAEKVLATSGATAVVLNDISEVDGERHGFTLLPSEVTGHTLEDLCSAIKEILL